MRMAWRVCGFLFLVSCGWAAGRGSIAGTVFDLGGTPAALAGVTLVNRETGFRVTVAADQQGNYRAADLPAGSYQVVARARGALSYAQASATVRDGQRVELSLFLSAQGTAVEAGLLHELPLAGRNYLDAVRAGAGVTAGQQGGNLEGFGPYAPSSSVSFNTNGQRGQNNNFTIDGMDNNEIWIQGAAVQPPLEGIDTVTLVSGYLPAELGNNAGAAVNVRTRRGGDALHGSVFDYLRNSALNAANFFDRGHKPGLLSNQFGGSLGGPLRREDWFFFADAELLRERQGLTITSTVPTAEQKAGQFGTTPIYDPLSLDPASTGPFVRTEFPGNLIPASRIPSQARSLIGLYPEPNQPGTANNYLYQPDLIRNSNRYELRSDKALGRRGNVFARFSYGWTDTVSPSALASAASSDITQYANGGNTGQTSWSGGASHTLALRPTLINELRFAASRFDLGGTPADATVDAGALLGIPGLGVGGLPDVRPTGFAQLGAAEPLPLQIRTASYQLEDTLEWTTRRHAWKFGFQAIRRQADGSATTWSNRGAFFFTPDYTSQPGVAGTGDSIASLLLGFPSEVRREIQFEPYHLRGWEWAGFVQDEFKLGGRLTIQAGVRYSLFPPVTEANNRMVNFTQDYHAPALNIFAGQNGVNQYAGRSYNKHAIAPHVGLAIDLTGNGSLVLRAGYSTDYDTGSYLMQGTLARNYPYAALQDMYNGSLAVGPTLAGGLPAPERISLDTPELLNYRDRAIYAVEMKPYTQDAEQWGLFLEGRVAHGLLLQIGGTGSMGAHLYSSFNMNQASPGPEVIAERRWDWHVPQLPRIDFLTFSGGSTYYGGQVKVSRQTGSGVQFQASYTFSKAEDDSIAPSSDQVSRPWGLQDIYYHRGARSVSSFDVAHRVTATAFYELPFKHVALARWQVSAVVIAQTGLPFTPELAVNGLNNGNFQLPDRLGSGALPASERSYLHWFDTGAFALPPLFHFGDAGFNIVRGPGQATADVALARSFALGERLRLRARVEAFNLLNRTNFALPNRFLGVESSAAISHTATPARQMQLAVRAEW
jgi:hypothetical protein